MSGERAPADLLITGIGQLFTGRPARSAAEEDPSLSLSTFHPELIGDAVVAAGEGSVLYAGPAEGLEEVVDATGAEVVEAGGALVTPGLIDCHTHLVFAGTREDEYALRATGATYQEIAASGGGIRRSVRQFREAETETLLASGEKRMRLLLAAGTTTVEIKSGYGLSPETELRALAVIGRLSEARLQRVRATFLGAHAVPEEYEGRQADYVDLVAEEMIPAVAEQGVAGFCDVFCETGYFTLQESERILRAGQAAGLGAKIHSDEFDALGGSEMAAALGAVSADHLTALTPQGVSALAGSSTVPVLLPGTTLFLGKSDFAPARDLLEAGSAVALATDFNPGSSMFLSLPLIMTIACSQMRMHPAEALAGVTVNAARALSMGDEVGRLERGMAADLVVWDAQDYREIPYAAGHPLVTRVVIAGQKRSDPSQPPPSQSGQGAVHNPYQG